MSNRTSSRWAPLVLVVCLLLLLFLVKQCRKTPATDKPVVKNNPKTTNNNPAATGLNRHPNVVHYSKHAVCRMSCRHISEQEVGQILETGKINYTKSEISNKPECKKKYAVEGTTTDNQRVRIIFAPCQNEVTVVTVIDMGKDWYCDCE